MRNLSGNYLIVFLLLFYLSITQYKYINTFPSNIHAWAQADRYAIALGFVENDLNFFQPQTYVYNHQFPNNFEIPAKQTITAVDFPIHDYVPAIIMKISGHSSPWIFRCYILLYSLLGLYYLYRLTYSHTSDNLKSIFVVLFAATSPVFVYYQGGFLPTIPSLSNAIIGIYFYSKYLSDNKKNDFAITIFFLTLAALARTTFAIPLIAIYCLEFARILKKESTLITKILPVVLSTVILIGYQLYNSHLRNLHGSMFLNYILPPSSVEDAKEIIFDTYKNWALDYFTAFQYTVMFVILIIASYFFLRRNMMDIKIKNWGLLFIIYLIGCLVFSCLMLQQFVNHDYYFLDTFFLPVIMLLIFLFALMPKVVDRTLKKIFVTAFLGIALIMIMQVVKSQNKRHQFESWNKTQTMIYSYENADKFLDSLNISKNAKILTFNSFGPNIPFIQMKRKGYVVVKPTTTNIKKALSWNYDYVVFEKISFVSDLASQFPILIQHLIKVAENNHLLVCKYSKKEINQGLDEFIISSEKQVELEKTIDFENIEINNEWSNVNLSDTTGYKSSHSGQITPKEEYGLTFTTKKIPKLDSPRLLFVSSYFIKNVDSDCNLVLAINSSEKTVYYQSYNLKELVRKQNTWQELDLKFQLPPISDNNCELVVYLWNTGKSEFLFDDFSLRIY